MGKCLSIVLLMFLTSIATAKVNKDKLPVSVDVIEFNTVKNEFNTGYQQFIFWKWSPEYNRYHCHGWSLYNENGVHPITKLGDTYTFNGRIKITSRIFIQTATKIDPERENQKIFPDEFRSLK